MPDNAVTSPSAPTPTNDPATTATTLPTGSALPEPPAAVVPGRTLGVVGFALSFFALVNMVALVLCIVAFVRGKRYGYQNGFALAGIIIASIGICIMALIAAVSVPMLVDAAQTCSRLGDGIHQIGSATYTCTPTSFHVSRSLG